MEFKFAKGRTTWVALTLDMKKSYDHLKSDFLVACLTQLGIHVT